MPKRGKSFVNLLDNIFTVWYNELVRVLAECELTQCILARAEALYADRLGAPFWGALFF